MKCALRPYQEIAVDFLHSTPRAGLFKDMGLGKTLSVLSLLNDLSLVEDCFPAIVFAPLRVAKTVWAQETQKWDHLKHLRIERVIGSPIERKAALKRPADIYVTNYENAPWLIETRYARGKAWPYATTVADESTKLKGFRLRQSTERARWLARVAVHPKTKRWVNLTGTPAPNGLLDLWGQMWFIDQGQRLGASYTAFIERWFRPNFNGHGYEPLPGANEQIHKAISDVCLTIEAKDWFDIEEPITSVINVDLPAAAMAQYRDMERLMFMELEGIEFEAFTAAAKTAKCAQMANGAIYTNEGNGDWVEVHKAKLDALEDIIEEASGAPILVAYHFVSDLARLQARFPKGRQLRTEKDIDDWNAKKIGVAFIHPQSAGHGLNLQHGGNQLVFFSLNWNLEEHLQVIERIGPVRQMQAGYKRPVYLRYIVARDTIDEAIMDRLLYKKSVQDALKEAMKRRPG